MVRRRSLLFSASGRRKMHDGGHHGRDGDGRTRRPRLGRWQLENTGRFLWRLHGGDWGRRGGGRNCGERQMKEKKTQDTAVRGRFLQLILQKIAGRPDIRYMFIRFFGRYRQLFRGPGGYSG